MAAATAASVSLVPCRSEMPGRVAFDDVIPDVIITLSLSLLGASDLANFCVVSVRWRRLADNRILWLKLDPRDTFPLFRKIVFAAVWNWNEDANRLAHGSGLNFAGPTPSHPRALFPILKKTPILTIPVGLTLDRLLVLARQHHPIAPIGVPTTWCF
jgi:hypothetical protein